RTLTLRQVGPRPVHAYPATVMSYGESVAGWVAEHRAAAWIADAPKDARVARRDWWEARGYKSLIALPMVHGDTLIAVLTLVGKAPFPVRHREMLELFAAQAAVAITNARLYADSNARREAAGALATRTACATPDVIADPRLAYTPETRAELAERTHRAMLAVPLIVTGRALGALIVGDATGRRFTPEEIARAEAFADQAALALEN